MEKKRSTKEIFLLGGTYASMYLGIGVATGQEVMQYFTNHGIISYAAILLYIVIASAVVCTIMGMAKVQPGADTYEYYFGKWFGKFWTLIMNPLLSLLGIGVMITGAGAVFAGYFGLPSYAGIALMAFCLCATYLTGIKGIVDILGRCGPVLIIVATIAALVTIGWGNGFSGIEDLVAANTERYVVSDKWWWGSVLYGVSVGSSVIFLGKISTESSSLGVAVKGAAFGNLLIVIGLLAMNTTFISNYAQVANSEIPVIDLISMISPILGAAYGIIVFAALFTTLMPGYWQMCDVAARAFSVKTYKETGKNKKIADILVSVGFSVLFLFCHKIPFAAAMNIFLPIMGYIGGVSTICIVIGVIRYFVKKQRNKGVVEENSIA